MRFKKSLGQSRVARSFSNRLDDSPFPGPKFKIFIQETRHIMVIIYIKFCGEKPKKIVEKRGKDGRSEKVGNSRR